MKGSLYLAIALFVLVATIFITNNEFFTSLYNSVVGRVILVAILIVITINSVVLAVLLLVIIIVLSQNKKRIVLKMPPPEEEKEKDRFSLTETLYKENKEHEDDRFMYKNYNKKQAYKKSKRKTGPNVVQLSESMRPKPSKNFPLFPNIPNPEIMPFSQSTYYKL